MIVMGIDGCRAGWVAVSQDLTTDLVSWQLLNRIDGLASLLSVPSVVALDIPIGLPERGARACDVAARRLLGQPRGSSVFPAPIRPVLDAGSYAEACEIRFAVEGKKMSRQAWGIVPKIREVDGFLRGNPVFQPTVHEAHPEVSFYCLAGGRPMEHSKRTLAGRLERRSLLANVFGNVVDEALLQRRSLQSQEDDVLDAFALLWSARRIAASVCMSLPASPTADPCGLPMQILA